MKKHASVARPLFALLALGFTLTATQTLFAQSGPLEDLSAFPRTSLEVLHGKKKVDPRVFNVWIANNAARQEQGLMFVQDLPQGEGMYFPLKKPKKMAMWMKNTYVELDMLFIDEKGVIEQIVERAHPLSVNIINSDKTVGAVLEIRGGEAQRLEIKVGDHVDWTPPDGCDCTRPEPVHTQPSTGRSSD
jgi:uncharacterized membrane protein (UPF0127 family)